MTATRWMGLETATEEPSEDLLADWVARACSRGVGTWKHTKIQIVSPLRNSSTIALSAQLSLALAWSSLELHWTADQVLCYIPRAWVWSYSTDLVRLALQQKIDNCERELQCFY